MNFTGWNPHDEEKDFADYSGLCQGNILNWSDVESQLVREAVNPFTMTIPEAVGKLQQAGKSSYQDYTFGRQETNDCCSWGTANGIDLTQIAQDQLAGGSYKTFLGGAVDGGDLSFNTYFAPNKGKPQIAGVRNSTVFTPQFVLVLAHKTDVAATLQGFFASGVNFSGGNDLKGDYGKVVGSSLKFKITGEPKWGYEAVGTIAASLYGDMSVVETAYQKLYKQTTSEMPDDALLNA